MWRFYGGASAALSRHSSVVSVRSIVSVASTSLPQRPPLSIAGQEVGKHFISGDEIDQKLENPTVRWFRAPGMDAFAAELLELHEGSLELEALGGNLQVGQKSTNGLVDTSARACTWSRTPSQSTPTPSAASPLSRAPTRGRRLAWPSAVWTIYTLNAR